MKQDTNRIILNRTIKAACVHVCTLYFTFNTLSTSGRIHAFNKSGCHLEFSIADIIRGKTIHVAKMATKDESSVEVDFAVCSYKKECFYFISRGIFSLYNVFMGMLS